MMMFDRKETNVLLKFSVDGIHFRVIGYTYRDMTFTGTWYWHRKYEVLIYGYGSYVKEKHETIGYAMKQLMEWF